MVTDVNTSRNLFFLTTSASPITSGGGGGGGVALANPAISAMGWRAEANVLFFNLTFAAISLCRLLNVWPRVLFFSLLQPRKMLRSVFSANAAICTADRLFGECPHCTSWLLLLRWGCAHYYQSLGGEDGSYYVWQRPERIIFSLLFPCGFLLVISRSPELYTNVTHVVCGYYRSARTDFQLFLFRTADADVNIMIFYSAGVLLICGCGGERTPPFRK